MEPVLHPFVTRRSVRLSNVASLNASQGIWCITNGKSLKFKVKKYIVRFQTKWNELQITVQQRMFYGRSEVSDPGQEECGILNEEQLGNQIVPIQFAIFRRGHSKIPVTIITQDHLHSIIQSMVKGMMSM